MSRNNNRLPVCVVSFVILSLIVIPMPESRNAQASEEFSKQVTDGGITLLHEKRSEPPVVAVRIFVPTGSSSDPEGKEGLARLTARVLASRTTDRDLREFNRFKSRFGLKIGTSVYPDFTEFSFTAIRDHHEQLLGTIGDLFSIEPLPDRLLDHLKRQQLASLAGRQDRTHTLALDSALETFYGDHPYSHPPIGRIDSVKSLRSQDVVEFYRNHYSPEGTVVSTVGAVSENVFVESLGNLSLPASSPRPVTADLGSPADTRLVLDRNVDQPTHLVMRAAPHAGAESYVATKVLDAILGGGMSSRLFLEMREKRSLGYQVASSYPSRRLTSTFRVFLGGGQPDGGEFRRVLDQIWEDLKTSGPADTELRRAKDYLIGNFKLNHETAGKKAWYRGFYEVLGLGADFDRRYPDRIRAITTDSVRSTVEKLLDGPSLFLSIQPEK